MTSEEIELLQGYILRQLQEKYPSENLTVYRIFLNYSTLRLRPLGNVLLSKLYDSYPFKMEKTQKIKSRQLVSLYNKMKYPYFLNKQKIVVYSEQDAFILKLGGFDAWTEF